VHILPLASPSQVRGSNFDQADQENASNHNLILWKGSVGDKVAYPAERDGKDLSKNRGPIETNGANRGFASSHDSSGPRSLAAVTDVLVETGGSGRVHLGREQPRAWHSRLCKSYESARTLMQERKKNEIHCLLCAPDICMVCPFASLFCSGYEPGSRGGAGARAARR